MPSFKFLSHHKTSDGFIVVAVLWILGALATLAAIYALYVHETTFVFVGHDERLQAQELALAGVEVAASAALPRHEAAIDRCNTRQSSSRVGRR